MEQLRLLQQSIVQILLRLPSRAPELSKSHISTGRAEAARMLGGGKVWLSSGVVAGKAWPAHVV